MMLASGSSNRFLSWCFITTQILCCGGLVDSFHLRGLNGGQENSVVCTTEEQCKDKFLSMNTGGTFLVGEYPTKGCFSKNSNIYFGTGSTTAEEDLALTDLPGIQERIWCDDREADTTSNPEHSTTNPNQMLSSANRPTTQPSTDDDFDDVNDVTPTPSSVQTNARVCTTPDQCLEQVFSLGTGGSLLVGDYPTKGCFSKNGNVYFGTGSVNEEELAKPDLPGLQQRIWCDMESKAPTLTPSAWPRPSVTNPTNQPTLKHVTNKPTQTIRPTFQTVAMMDDSTTSRDSEQPTLKHVTNKPTQTIRPTFQLVATTEKPVMNDLTTSRDSEQPTIKHATNNPIQTNSSTFQPVATTEKPVMDTSDSEPTKQTNTEELPTSHPTSMASTANPTMQSSSSNPVTASPKSMPSQMTVTKQPTRNSASITSTTDNPTIQLTQMKVGESNMLSIRPFPMPVTMTPSKPVTGSASNPPTKKPIAHMPTSNRTQMPSTTADNQVNNSATIDQSVGISPLAIRLTTDPQTKSIDADELGFFILNHLLKEMEEKFPSNDGSSSYILVSPVLDKLRHLQEVADDGSIIANEFGFVFSGVLSFSGDSAPSAEVLDNSTRESFAGESGDAFVRSLQDASDAGLKSTRSVSVVASSEGSKEVDSLQNELKSSTSDDDLYATKRWNILTIVFSVGLVLIAMHVMKTRRDRKKSDRQSPAGCPELSRHVNEVKLNEATSANSQDDSVRESISARSIEIKQLATGIMSLLTPDDDELSSNQTKDEHASNAGNSRSHGHGMNERKKTNLFCWFGDGTDDITRLGLATKVQSSNGSNDMNLGTNNHKTEEGPTTVVDRQSHSSRRRGQIGCGHNGGSTTDATKTRHSERSELSGNADHWYPETDANDNLFVDVFGKEDVGDQNSTYETSNHHRDDCVPCLCIDGGGGDVLDDTITEVSESGKSAQALDEV